MNHTELNNSLKLFNEALGQHRMTQALAALDSYLTMIKAPWQLHRRLEELREQYRFMVDYALRGASDPERPNLYARISAEALAIAETAKRLGNSMEKNTLYFSTLRYENTQTGDTIQSLIERYNAVLNKSNLVMLSGSSSASSDIRLELESLERRIFNRVWVTYPLPQSEVEALLEALSSTLLPAYFKKLLLSALMLGGLTTFDEQRLILLASPYLSSDPDLEMQSLCGLLLVMWRHNNVLDGLRHFPAVAASLEEKPGWNEDVKTVFLNFIRTRDTEKITKTIREDITPSLIKLKPKFKDLGKGADRDKNLEELLDPESNPDWIDLIENSGLGDKLRKMTEMQQEGADIMMSSFGSLKTYPFFNEISNWFIPFHSENSAVARVMEKSGPLLNLILQSPALCDSDKYSMVLSISSLPEAQRSMLEGQLSAQEEMIKSHGAAMMFPERHSREQIVNKYVQDLYRFFHLFRRKGEFEDPFHAPVNLVGVKYVDKVFADDDTIAFLADFYFKRGYYDDAARLYSRIVEDRMPDASLYQKIGYSLHQSGDIEGALTWYERSELIDSANVWTLRRIASILWAQQRYNEAEEYYRRLDALKPNDINILLNLGSTLLALDRPEEALKIYFKVEFLEGETPRKSLRPIAWATFLTRDFDRSRQFYAKLKESGLECDEDILNHGHLSLAAGRVEEALKDYTEYLKRIGNDVSRFEKELSSDSETLKKVGVDPLLLDIVVDKAMY